MNDDEVRRVARELVDVGCDAIVSRCSGRTCGPRTSERVRELIQAQHPNVAVSISSEIAPVLGEYERTASTVVNAYLTKKVDGYIAALADRLRKAGFKHQLMVMLSNGGVAPDDDARKRAAYLLASGPAGGVIGARNLGQVLGHANVLTTDVGGTSFDVGLVVDGQPEYAREPLFDKYHLSFPMIDVVSIGSGGGSIAWIDRVGISEGRSAERWRRAGSRLLRPRRHRADRHRRERRPRPDRPGLLPGRIVEARPRAWRRRPSASGSPSRSR